VSENEVRPLLVLVSGAPGSGKTTLARQRAKALKQLPEQLFDNQTKRFAAIRDLVTEPLDLGCPLIEVNTENDLDPSLDQIVRALTEF
jgi:nucleoside-triphosphatase THEP1